MRSEQPGFLRSSWIFVKMSLPRNRSRPRELQTSLSLTSVPMWHKQIC